MPKKRSHIVKASLSYAFSILGGASTIACIWGYSVRDINDKLAWWIWLIILTALFLVLSTIIYFIIKAFKHRNYSTRINGKPVTIKIGDIFSAGDWKLIPCNERFDTLVDDRIIAHDSLNGKMIDHYIDDLDELKQSINDAEKDKSSLKPEKRGKTIIYPLGRIISYKDFLMLAFSHFDDYNRAYINVGEYEQLLIRMWSEIRRVYAAKHITMPLIGAGITDIAGMPEKDYTELLRCILCTLRSSRFNPKRGITIVLTEEVMKAIDMNAIREEF